MKVALTPVQLEYRAYHKGEVLLWEFGQQCVIDGQPAIQARSYTLETSLVEMVDAVNKVLRHVCVPHGWQMQLENIGSFEFVITATDGKKPRLICLVSRSGGRSNDQRKPSRAHFNIHIHGAASEVNPAVDALDALYKASHLPEVRWVYKQGDDIESASIILDPPDQMHDEFYPFIREGVDAFLDDYLASSASILFMSGAPGTGKTTLIRHCLHRHGLRAVMTYEEALLSADYVFVNFLLSVEENVLLIEDADTMLQSRPDDKKRIARFLNVSDGVVKLSDKKVIFTTNLENFKDIDDALTRPGRCFGAMQFRALSYDEAKAACAAGGLHLPGDNRAYTLAELFNQRAVRPTPRKVGF